MIYFDARDFNPKRIQPVTHGLGEHPLLQLDALRALARRLPEKQVRFHAITAGAGSDFERATEQHKHALAFDEALADIERSGSWIAFHNVQTDPEYRALLDQVLDGVRAQIDGKDPGMFNRAFWIFIQSPGSVTPFHMDHENNFLMQIRGRKHARVWHPEDCLTGQALETFHSEWTRKDARYDETYNASAHVFELQPGQGVYMPSTGPHLVHNLDNVSITISMTYCTAATRRLETINRGNRVLRKFGVKPLSVGASPWRDSLKYGMFRSYYDTRSVLRGQPRDIPEWARL